jgi:hypothetical protein
MGFTANNIIGNGGEIISPIFDSNELSKQEIEYLLLLIKDSKFLGEHLEIVYNIVIKLQNQYSK